MNCSICDCHFTNLLPCDTGYVCEDCREKTLLGRDSASRQIKLKRRAQDNESDALKTLAAGGTVSDEAVYAIEAAHLFAEDEPQQSKPLLCGEALQAGALVDTLAVPGVVALDASVHRVDLITTIGNDVAAMALDASDTIQASNSLEKMMAHQLATLHKAAMSYAAKATMCQETDSSVRMFNISIRAMNTFQKGLLTFKRLRGSGEQRITIKHVNVSDGGQAVIGNVQPRGAEGGKI